MAASVSPARHAHDAADETKRRATGVQRQGSFEERHGGPMITFEEIDARGDAGEHGGVVARRLQRAMRQLEAKATMIFQVI